MSAVGGNEASGQKANEPRFFYEDEVFRFHRGHLQFGMVVENSEFVSSDDDDDGDDRQRPKQGFVRVAWHPKGHEDVVRETKVVDDLWPLTFSLHCVISCYTNSPRSSLLASYGGLWLYSIGSIARYSASCTISNHCQKGEWPNSTFINLALASIQYQDSNLCQQNP